MIKHLIKHLIKRGIVLAGFILLPALNGWAAEDWFAEAAAKYRLDSNVLRAIAELETNFNPWAFNVNGAPFFADSKREAIDKLKALHKTRWMLEVELPTGEGQTETNRWFFAKETQARDALQELIVTRYRRSAPPIISQEIRKLNIRKTDIGLMQINYYWHGEHFPHVDFLFEPKNNIDYAARHLRELMDQHKDLYKAVAHYHSHTPTYQQRYLRRFKRIYQRYSQIEQAGNQALPCLTQAGIVVEC